MLPSQEPQMPQAQALIVVCVPTASTGAYVAKASLGAQVQGSYPLFQVKPAAGDREISILIQSSQTLEDSVLEAADGLLLILDGQLGLDPHSMSIWSKATDQSIPRHIGAVHVTTGRADFDELIAIATRVLDPDLMVRYLPIDSDVDECLVGQYDLLTADIHDCSTGVPVIRHGDPEHVALTADRRDDLFEELAHAGLADEILETHRLGLPVSIPALAEAWNDEHIVSITALDNQVGSHIVQEWFSHVPTRWMPSVTEGDTTLSIEHSGARLGIGIGEGIARMWGQVQEEIDLEVVMHGVVLPIAISTQTGGCILAQGLQTGSTVRATGSHAEVLVPRF